MYELCMLLGVGAARTRATVTNKLHTDCRVYNPDIPCLHQLTFLDAKVENGARVAGGNLKLQSPIMSY